MGMPIPGWMVRREQQHKRRLAEQARRRRERERARGVVMNEATRRQLTELRKKAERAAGRAVARERRLFVAGAPVHDWERHQEQLRAIRAERNQVLAEVRREAERITREQRELLESINDGISRADALEPFERSEAISRLTLAEKEIRTLSEGVIRRRLEYVREHGSKLEKFAWAELA